MSGPQKRAKVAHSGTGITRRSLSSPTKQPSLHDLFAKSSASVQAPVRPTEDEELEWAIQASLREAEAVARKPAIEASNTDAVAGDVSGAWAADRFSQNDFPIGQLSRESTDSARTSAKPLADAAVNVALLGKASSDCGNEGAWAAEEASKKLDSTPGAVAPGQSNSKNAFTKLMSSHSEAKEWANADAVESRNYNGPAKSRAQRRTAPFYKVLTGMPISVDAFRFGEIQGCQAYFLSHFHADHYGGLTSAWTHGPVYCSQTTANLVRSSLYVNDLHICPIPMDTPTVIPKTGGVRVTLLDANHCPGSCLFLFEGPQTEHILPTPAGTPHPALPPSYMTFRYLHCGDFRASPRHTNHPLIKGKRLDIIYLDTTYCNPRYCFPAQEMVVSACADRVRQLAPEQCAEGQRIIAEGLIEPEEDWRKPAMSARKVEEAREAARDRKTGEALQEWLNKRGIISETDEDAAEKVKEDPGQAKTEDDEDFGDMDFRDEEIAFRSDFSRGSSVAEMRKDDVVGASTSASNIKDEPLSDDEVISKTSLPDVQDEMCTAGRQQETKPRECHDGKAPASLKDEDVALDSLEVDDRSGLGHCDIKIEIPTQTPIVEQKNSRNENKAQADYPRVLVVVGTYTIGKEKVVLGCAKALGTKIYCADKRKYRVYAQLEDPELHSLLTRDPKKAYVHVTSLMTINGDALKEHVARMRADGMRIDRSVAFRPTGWTYRPPAGMDVVSPSLERLIQWNQQRLFNASQLSPTRDSTPQYAIYGVPYSEHSSFFELTAFCLSIDYGRIIATVNVGNPNSRAKMARWMDKWKAEKKRREGVPVDSRSPDYF